MSCTVPTADINSHRLGRFLFLIQIDKQPYRENVIDAIVRSRMGLNILVHITDFRLDLWTEPISESDKTAILIEPQVRLESWLPVRII